MTALPEMLEAERCKLMELSRLSRKLIATDHNIEEQQSIIGRTWIRRVRAKFTGDLAGISWCVETCGSVLTVYTPYAPEFRSLQPELRKGPVMFTEKDGVIQRFCMFDFDDCMVLLKRIEELMVLDALSEI